MFARLPQRAASGDEAIRMVWEMAREEREKREARNEKQREVLASLPEAVRAAIEARDNDAYRAAMQQLAPEHANAIQQKLREAGIIGGGESSGSDMARVLQEFDPLLRAIAAVANGDETEKQEIEATLANLEEKGWHLASPVQRIWNGERDAALLTEGLDEQDRALVKRILEYLSPDPSPTRRGE
ncbi:MAG: hypothetical protein HY741_21480 [Chloroflexi bacterium]|nr:hypothetical protein [Chloroflexota bacterium]